MVSALFIAFGWSSWGLCWRSMSAVWRRGCWELGEEAVLGEPTRREVTFAIHFPHHESCNLVFDAVRKNLSFLQNYRILNVLSVDKYVSSPFTRPMKRLLDVREIINDRRPTLISIKNLNSIIQRTEAFQGN